MKKNSLNYIPSFEDISINNCMPIPEMVFILSRNSFSSIKSLEHIQNDEYPIFQQDNNISFDLFQQEEIQPK